MQPKLFKVTMHPFWRQAAWRPWIAGTKIGSDPLKLRQLRAIRKLDQGYEKARKRERDGGSGLAAGMSDFLILGELCMVELRTNSAMQPSQSRLGLQG